MLTLEHMGKLMKNINEKNRNVMISRDLLRVARGSQFIDQRISLLTFSKV